MPTPRQMRKFVNKMINQKIDTRQGTAKIRAVNGNLADITLPGNNTYHRNCRIVGDPNQLFTNLTVSIRWEEYNGSMRPVVLAPGGGAITGESRAVITATSGGSVSVDNITIENSTVGIRVKEGGISEMHLDFVPALRDHQHAIGEIIPGWSVSNDGILFSSQVSINPNGTITLGRSPDIVKLGVEDATYRIWAGNSVPGSAPFSVSKTGHLVSSSAVIGGWTINTTQIKKTGIILDSSTDQILVGASGEITLDGASKSITVGTSDEITIDGDAATITVGASSPQIVIDGANKILKSSDYQPGSSGYGIQATDGYAEFNNVRVRGTLSSSVFEYGNIQATAGTLMVSRSAGKLHSDFTSPASVGSNVYISVTNDNAGSELFSLTEYVMATATISSGGTGYAVGDILTINSGTGATVEVLEVSAGVVTKIWPITRGSGCSAGTKTTTGGTGTNCTITITVDDIGDIIYIKSLTTTGVAVGWYEIRTKYDYGDRTQYLCELLYGNLNTDFEKGTGISSLGQHSTGTIYLSADGTIGHSANISFIQWWRNRVSTVSVVAGGSLYQVGDILRLNDSGALLPCKVQVTALSGSAVSAVTILEYGSDYSTGTKSTWAESTGGTPSGCTINITALSNPWTTQFLFGRVGNMKSSYGAPAEDRYGFGFGNYDSGDYISYNAEADGQLILKSSSGTQIDQSGIAIDVGDYSQVFTTTESYKFKSSALASDSGESGEFFWIRAWMDEYSPGVYSGDVEITNEGASIYPLAYSQLSILQESEGATTGSAQIFLRTVDKSGTGTRTASILVNSDNNYATITFVGDDITFNSTRTWIAGSSGARVSQALQVGGTGLTAPTTGSSVEISWQSTYGRVMSYQRAATAQDKPLQLRGSIVYLNEGGSNILTVDGGDVYTSTFADIGGSCSFSGWSSRSTTAIYRKTIGDLVWVWIYVTGTSNADTTRVTVPNSGVSSSNYQAQVVCRIQDGGTWKVGLAALSTGTPNIYFYTDQTGGTWATSGVKTVLCEIFYQAA